MIRDATIEDIPHILEMARRFFEKSGYWGEFDSSCMAATVRNLIESPSGILIVSDGGMVGALVYPLYMTGELMAQEFFWWSEDGQGRSLISALESRTRALGAKTITMIALDNLRPTAVGKVYRRRGYKPMEHSWVKEL